MTKIHKTKGTKRPTKKDMKNKCRSVAAIMEEMYACVHSDKATKRQPTEFRLMNCAYDWKEIIAKSFIQFIDMSIGLPTASTNFENESNRFINEEIQTRQRYGGEEFAFVRFIFATVFNSFLFSFLLIESVL